MINRRQLLGTVTSIVGGSALSRLAGAGARTAFAATTADPGLMRVTRFIDDDSVELTDGTQQQVVQRGGIFAGHHLMEVVGGDDPCAVLEDFRSRLGPLLLVTGDGVTGRFEKSLEPTAAGAADNYLGHTAAEVTASAPDLLARQVLATPADPDYAMVERAFPPIQKLSADSYSFVGTPDNQDKIGFTYGGRTANFDPAVYQPSIDAIVKNGQVWNGLVGGYLPVLRFVYPEPNGDWTEYLAFAPFRRVNDNPRFQPVWYRVSRIEGGRLAWSRHFDSYHPFPSRPKDDARRYYRDLVELRSGWDRLLAPAMQINLPDAHLANLTRFSLVRAMMSRSAGYPKYGAVEKNYGGSEHDGFPDTFTVETAAMCEWGLIERAGSYIENYFRQYVTDDGSILYRGPETGQYGRMLTVAAQYFACGGYGEVLLRCRSRLDGIARLLLALRARAQRLPADDPAYGMISGWSEADSCLEKDPQRYDQPYFSNSTEAARGWRDLGRAWRTIGTRNADAGLVAWGEELIREAESLRRDIKLATERSTLKSDGEHILPAIAGVREPAHIVVKRDFLDPQYRGYRAYMEMMYSGNLSAQQIGMVADYRSNHYDTLLGVPTAYGFNTREMAGFLSYGHGYGLIQIDRIREALLLTYSLMAHQYTRGTWLAPETRRAMSAGDSAPYCSPAQLAVPLLVRWLLVFEDPESETLWLGRGLPRDWLAPGKSTAASAVPTRWGRVGFEINSQLQRNIILARVNLPAGGVAATTQLRLRAPLGARLQAVTVNGRDWPHFDAASELVSFAPHTAGQLDIRAHYRRR